MNCIVNNKPSARSIAAPLESIETNTALPLPTKLAEVQIDDMDIDENHNI